MDEKAEIKLLEEHVNLLMEHFDSVQIFVTRKSDDAEGTVNANKGDGNWFARYGQVKDWITRSEERSREEVRQED